MPHLTKLSHLGNPLGLRPGDAVVLKIEGTRLVVCRVDRDYLEAMDLGRRCADRYRQALSWLAR